MASNSNLESGTITWGRSDAVVLCMTIPLKGAGCGLSHGQKSKKGELNGCRTKIK